MEPYYWVAISVLVLIASISSTAKAGQSTPTSFTDQAALRACNILAERFPALVSFPNDRLYLSQQAQYWASNQADFAPTCRLSPKKAEQVSSLVSQLVAFGDEVHFAITSGGHSTAHGASNLNDGITLDLSGLSSVSVAPDYLYVEVGPRTRWLDIYQILDPLGQTVSGGRASSVGVGGYLLGGGISMLSGRYGWSADTLLSIEVVLVNGTVINTSPSSRRDLFSVLKGGRNNFGIAAGFHLETFPLQESLRVALLRYSDDRLPRVIRGLADFARNAHLDPSSSAELSVGFDALSNRTAYVLMPTSANSRSGSGSKKKDEFPLWKLFLEVPTLETSMFRAGMTEVVEMIEINNPYGFRYASLPSLCFFPGIHLTSSLMGIPDDARSRVYKTTLTVHNDPELLSKITDLFTAHVVHNRTLDTEQHGSDARSHLPGRDAASATYTTAPTLLQGERGEESDGARRRSGAIDA
ncbi:uncharacterized protein Z519_06651 [Cladophialophora bantiana CBS 173.52]|uniref:FAD-binding PCMH-type domain-containing protein n=1 Tax=Cladophialophora bantiana (strain ATCC 10958 / CBS 173.52 / CDC B-1940 / NIH 8579) TaxID=1442370 RepID=A0A0D2G246_CLAB1|nr:uncharacterized protein Z519_06651 [Cladophialophora bantiana CBS 173.52]KIW92802.1 hypothetical protein Z519_06651 [Cladophialophora bantiana CBS 173.52]